LSGLKVGVFDALVPNQGIDEFFTKIIEVVRRVVGQIAVLVLRAVQNGGGLGSDE
jgi:hypothetical protein